MLNRSAQAAFTAVCQACVKLDAHLSRSTSSSSSTGGGVHACDSIRLRSVRLDVDPTPPVGVGGTPPPAWRAPESHLGGGNGLSLPQVRGADKPPRSTRNTASQPPGAPRTPKSLVPPVRALEAGGPGLAALVSVEPAVETRRRRPNQAEPVRSMPSSR
jgi:hypothetical protein